MERRRLVTEENIEMGISGVVCKVEHPATRVYAKHMMVCVLKGTLTCNYEEKIRTALPGSLIFIMEGKPFSYKPKDCTALFFSIPVTCFPELNGEIQFWSDPAHSPDPGRPIRRLLAEIILTEYQGGVHRALKLQSLWKECIYLLMTGFLEAPSQVFNMQKKNPVNRRRENDFHNILELLNRSYMEPLQLKDIADSFFYTPSHLSRLFVKYTGMHFMEYLTGLRLQKAMPMLMQTGQEIQLIAERAGFPSTRAFSQAFHERYGMNPSEYRKALFNEAEEKNPESIRDNIRFLNEKGFFRVLFEEDRLYQSLRSHGMSASGLSLAQSNRPDTRETRWYKQKDIGTISLNLEGQPSSVSLKHKILNIPRLRDLLLDEVQEQVRSLQETLCFEYINCHGFLSDDMQIFTPNTAVFATEHRFVYNFMLYEKVLKFIRSQNLKIIIQLGNTPSFLAGSVSGQKLHDGSVLTLPESDADWEEYIIGLFSFLRDSFGEWIASCPVIPCPDMEFAVIREKENMDEWFAFYLRTCSVIRRVVPGIRFSSPSFSSTGEGLRFARSFLEFCRKKNCEPASVNIGFVMALQTIHPFHFQPLELHSYISELRHQMHLLKYPEDMPVNLLEYYYTFRFHTICDSCVGAMLPINMALLHQHDFQMLGYWYTLDRTTESAFDSNDFYGGKGLLNQFGRRKASYYSLLYLSRLGSAFLASEDGFILTKNGPEFRMLLYYDIPENSWPEPWNPEDPDDFYSLFPEEQVTLSLIDIPGDKLLIIEGSVTGQNSAFEKWTRSGGPLLQNGGKGSDSFDTLPDIQVREAAVSDNRFVYRALLKPFEIRMVTIKPEV